jgi:hypothetical protein
MHSRNAGLQRLRSTTKRFGVAAALLTGAFAALAAAGNSGKHHRAAVKPRLPRRLPAASTRTTTRVPAPPSLPPLESSGSSQVPPSAPAAPSQPPEQAQAPPVAVSGGS